MSSTILSLLNWKTEDPEGFSLLSSQGPFELRLYHRMLCVKVKLSGSSVDSWKKGFIYLQDYLKGNNFKVTKVINAGPRFFVKQRNIWEACILLPAELASFDAPKPINRLLKIEEIPPARFAVLKSAGNYSAELFERKSEELKKWIHYKSFEMKDSLRVFLSDSSILRPRFEVQYEVF